MYSITESKMAELWKALPGWEGLYDVSDRGAVRSVASANRYQWKRGGVLVQRVGRKGYLQLRLCRGDGTSKTVKVHLLIALAFLGEPPDGMQVNHKNGNKLDNRPDNLEYVTCRQNIRHAWDNGLSTGKHMRGERSHRAKLTAADVRRIRTLSSTMTLKAIAELYGVSTYPIWSILKRKAWNHVE